MRLCSESYRKIDICDNAYSEEIPLFTAISYVEWAPRELRRLMALCLLHLRLRGGIIRGIVICFSTTASL